MRFGGSLLLCALATLSPAPARAQGCEVHIWPTTRFAATTSSIFLGGTMGGTHNAPTAKDNLAEVMSPERQAEVYRSLDLAMLMASKQPIALVIEPAMDAVTVKKKGPRLAKGGAACHYEIIIQGIAYGEDPVWGKALATSMILRRYDGQSEQARVTWIRGSQGVKKSLNKEAVGVEEAASVMKEALAIILGERVPVAARKLG